MKLTPIKDFLARHDGVFALPSEYQCTKCGGVNLNVGVDLLQSSEPGPGAVMILVCEDCGFRWEWVFDSEMEKRIRNDKFAGA